MHKIKYSSLIVSFAILFISSAGGWLMTAKAGDAAAANEFIKFGGPFAALIFMCKVVIFENAKKFLFYQILFIGVMGIDLAWFLSCFFLPLLWVDKIGLPDKMAIMVFYSSVCFFNVQFAEKIFSNKWDKVGAPKFEKIFDVRNETIDWPAVSKSMSLAAVIFVPGIPKKYDGLVSVLMLLFMILGLALRRSYPACSMAALSIPFSICAASCLQMSRYHFSEARVVRLIEIKKNIRFKSAG